MRKDKPITEQEEKDFYEWVKEYEEKKQAKTEQFQRSILYQVYKMVMDANKK